MSSRADPPVDQKPHRFDCTVSLNPRSNQYKGTCKDWTDLGRRKPNRQGDLARLKSKVASSSCDVDAKALRVELAQLKSKAASSSCDVELSKLRLEVDRLTHLLALKADDATKHKALLQQMMKDPQTRPDNFPDQDIAKANRFLEAMSRTYEELKRLFAESTRRSDELSAKVAQWKRDASNQEELDRVTKELQAASAEAEMYSSVLETNAQRLAEEKEQRRAWLATMTTHRAGLGSQWQALLPDDASNVQEWAVRPLSLWGPSRGGARFFGTPFAEKWMSGIHNNHLQRILEIFKAGLITVEQGKMHEKVNFPTLLRAAQVLGFPSQILLVAICLEGRLSTKNQETMDGLLTRLSRQYRDAETPSTILPKAIKKNSLWDHQGFMKEAASKGKQLQKKVIGQREQCKLAYEQLVGLSPGQHHNERDQFLTQLSNTTSTVKTLKGQLVGKPWIVNTDATAVSASIMNAMNFYKYVFWRGSKAVEPSKLSKFELRALMFLLVDEARWSELAKEPNDEKRWFAFRAPFLMPTDLKTGAAKEDYAKKRRLKVDGVGWGFLGNVWLGNGGKKGVADKTTIIDAWNRWRTELVEKVFNGLVKFGKGSDDVYRKEAAVRPLAGGAKAKSLANPRTGGGSKPQSLLGELVDAGRSGAHQSPPPSPTVKPPGRLPIAPGATFASQLKSATELRKVGPLRMDSIRARSHQGRWRGRRRLRPIP